MSIRETVWERKTFWSSSARFALLVTLAVLITGLGQSQWITGPLVNALLLLTVGWAGLSQAILVGMLTPLGAAVRGVLPLPMLVMIPFIALGNAALVSVYAGLRHKHKALALVAAAICKFALLYLSVTLLSVRPLHLLIGGNAQALALPETLVQMMSWPQLGTALAGGLLALGVEGAREYLRARREK